MSGGGGLAGVDMANDHDVDVDLFLSHCCSFCHEKGKKPNKRLILKARGRLLAYR